MLSDQKIGHHRRAENGHVSSPQQQRECVCVCERASPHECLCVCVFIPHEPSISTQQGGFGWSTHNHSSHCTPGGLRNNKQRSGRGFSVCFAQLCRSKSPAPFPRRKTTRTLFTDV